MAQTRDYYELLGVVRSANAEEIRAAYRKLARQYHPDVNESSDAATRFAEIQEAYEVLSDAQKRRTYDQFGHAAVGVGPAGGGGWAGHPGGVGGVGFDAADFADVFEGVFGGGPGASPFGMGAGRRAGPRQPTAHRGADTQRTLTISFMTAAQGGTENVHRREDGSDQTISVRIPPGIEHGSKLRIRGKGKPGAAGGSSGDLILTVKVGRHPYFRREGLDLLIDMPLTIAEAALGTAVTAPLLNGAVELKIPPGVASGRKLRVPERGLCDSNGRCGDFYAVIQIVGPEDDELSTDDLDLLRQLGERLKNPRESAGWADDVGEASD